MTDDITRPAPNERPAFSVAHAATLAAVCLAAVWMVGPSVNAGFGPVDDWHIVMWTRGEGRLSAARVQEVVRQELAPNAKRYNPGWKLSMIAEAWVVGDDPFLWHLNKVLLFTACAAGVYMTAALWLSPPAAATVAFLFVGTAASTAWVRLGAAEVYAMPPVVLAWYALLRRLRYGKTVRPGAAFPWLVLLLVTPLFKETFLTILPAAAVVLYVLLPYVVGVRDLSVRRFRWWDWLAVAAGAAAWCGYVGFVSRGVAADGHFYSQAGRTAAALLATTRSFLVEAHASTLLAVPVAAGGLLLLLARWPRAAAALRLSAPGPLTAGRYAVVVAALFALSVPQVVFYWGLVPDPTWLRHLGRYFQPFNLGLVAAGGVALFAAERAVRGAGPVRRYALLGLVAAAPVVALAHTARVNHRYARAYTAMTREYQAGLSRVAALTGPPGRGRPVLLRSCYAEEFEQVVATAYYLRARGYPAAELWYAPELIDGVTPDWLRATGADGIPGLVTGALRAAPAAPAAVVCFRDAAPGPAPPHRVVRFVPSVRF